MVGTLGAAALLVAGTQVAHADSLQIQKGDTVWGYSQKYHVSIDDIVKSNKLADANLIIAGQTINIPGVSTGSSTATTSTAATTSTVSGTSSATVAASSATSVSAASSSVASSAVATSAASSLATATSSTAATSSSVASSATSSAVSASSATTSSATTSSTTATATSASAVSSTSATTTTTTTSSSSSSSTTTTTSTGSMARGGGVSAALAIANGGIGYLYGGNSLSTGFDCSGLVQYVYGLSSSYRTTYQQATLGTHHTDVANAPYGSLLFWGSDSAPYHVAISLGNGSYVAAESSSWGIGVFTQSWSTPDFYINY